jgi:hypothetical protein
MRISFFSPRRRAPTILLDPPFASATTDDKYRASADYWTVDSFAARVIVDAREGW